LKGRTLAWLGAGLGVLVLFGGLAWGLAHPANPGSSSLLGRTAPEIAVQSLDGGLVRLSDLRGRPVVLNFWASWCAPCRTEAPVLAAASRSNPGVAFLGAAIEDSAGPARSFEAEFKVPYPDGIDSQAGYLRYGVTGPPETYFIDAQGKIRARYAGPMDGATLDRYLAELGS
jgi:cytochrome c biogenesis protein CcmG, thiol:disulfide interchange protein DsbE